MGKFCSQIVLFYNLWYVLPHCLLLKLDVALKTFSILTVLAVVLPVVLDTELGNPGPYQ